MHMQARTATLVSAVSNTAAQAALASDEQQDQDTAQAGATLEPRQGAPHSSGRSDANAGIDKRYALHCSAPEFSLAVYAAEPGCMRESAAPDQLQSPSY